MLVPQTPISSRIRQSVNNAKYTFKIQIPLHHFFACGITLLLYYFITFSKQNMFSFTTGIGNGLQIYESTGDEATGF